MSSTASLPPELCRKPEPLVVLSGLDCEKNQVHKSIWRAFSTGRSREREPFQFRCLPIDHQFPKPKLKPSGSCEWLLPKGILKTGWMRKHLTEIPAVVAVFYDLDWDNKDWQEKSNECAQRLETVRSNLLGRDSKLVVVLIQKRAPLPLGEDLNAMERAQVLCTKCDLPGKNLFVLSHTNLLYGCITCLESEFRDMAANYYHNRIKRVKSAKESLSKASHHLLFIRYEFKIAFFGELKQDQALALKHYQLAYNHLVEERMLDIHLVELKTVAGFINYKICQISFKLNASDAIAQFRRHTEVFAPRVGMPKLAFEHEAWMSEQFEILGDLFQDAIQLSLTALMTQHPGFYYQEAARHAINRRFLARLLCSATTDSASDRQASVSAARPALPPDSAPESDNLFSAPGQECTLPTPSPATANLSGTDPRPKRRSSLAAAAVDFVRSQSPLKLNRRAGGSQVGANTAAPGGLSEQSHVTTGGGGGGVPVEAVMGSNSGTGAMLSVVEKVDGSEFFGQRYWRQGVQSTEQLRASRENQGILELQQAELTVDHSAIIIPLLEQAHLQYKRYKTDRMKLHPLFLMGAEYFDRGDYSKALSCYSSIIDEYRRDKFWSIYTIVLMNIAKCSFAIAQAETFLLACLELMSDDSQLIVDEKERIHQALVSMFQTGVPEFTGVAPELEKTGNSDTVAAIRTRWLEHCPAYPAAPVGDNENSAKLSRGIVLDVSRLNTCIDCKVSFTRTQYSPDEPVQVAVFLRSHAPKPIGIRAVTIDVSHRAMKGSAEGHQGSLALSSTAAVGMTSTGAGNNYWISQSWTEAFVLPPLSGDSERNDAVRIVLFCFDPQTVGQNMKVDAVHLDLMSPVDLEADRRPPTHCTVTWKCPGSLASSEMLVTGRHRHRNQHPHRHGEDEEGEEQQQQQNAVNPRCSPALWDRSVVLSRLDLCCQAVGVDVGKNRVEPIPRWELVGSQVQAELLNRSSRLDVVLENQPPALTNERFTIVCRVHNREATEAKQVMLSVSLTDRQADGSPARKPQSSAAAAMTSSGGDQLQILSAGQSASQPMEKQAPSASDSTSLVNLAPDASLDLPVSLLCCRPGTRRATVQLVYLASFHNPRLPDLLLAGLSSPRVLATGAQPPADGLPPLITCRCAHVGHIEFPVLAPFTMTCSALSVLQSPISDLVVGEDFLLHIQLTNNSPWDLEILSTNFDLNSSVVFVDGAQDVQIANVGLQHAEAVTECQVCRVTYSSDSNPSGATAVSVEDYKVVSLGSYTVRWCRRQQPAALPGLSLQSSSPPIASACLPAVHWEKESPLARAGDVAMTASTSTVFQLNSCAILSLPAKVTPILPALAIQYSPLPVVFVLESRTVHPQEVVVSMRPSVNFLFCGNTRHRLRLLPGSPYQLTLTLLPVRSGYLALPQLSVQLTPHETSSAQNQQDTLRLHIAERMLRQLPTHIFILPADSQNNSSVDLSATRPVQPLQVD